MAPLVRPGDELCLTPVPPAGVPLAAARPCARRPRRRRRALRAGRPGVEGAARALPPRGASGARRAMILAKSPATAWRVIEGEAVILSLDTKVLRGLNAGGSRGWELIDGRRSVADIVAAADRVEPAE